MAAAAVYLVEFVEIFRSCSSIGSSVGFRKIGQRITVQTSQQSELECPNSDPAMSLSICAQNLDSRNNAINVVGGDQHNYGPPTQDTGNSHFIYN